jgi:hypothetical protein
MHGHEEHFLDVPTAAKEGNSDRRALSLQHRRKAVGCGQSQQATLEAAFTRGAASSGNIDEVCEGL